jgi:protein-disulfide isomerase
MPRLTLLLIALVAVLGFGVAYVAVRPQPPSLTEDQVRSIVSAAIAEEPELTDVEVRGLVAEALAEEPAPLTGDEVRGLVAEALAGAPRPLTDEAVKGLIATALAERDAALPQSHNQLDAATLNPMIEDYLLSNPRILQRVSAALDAEIRTAEAEAARLAIASYKTEIFDDPDHVVLGNPSGDVTLVELFDYNCGYCRQAVPDLATLLAEDPNLRVILKEFPILSQESVDAAKVAIAVARTGADYWQFHQKLYSSRGQIGRDSALAAARDLGLSPVALELDMAGEEVAAILDRSYELARNLSISGTPTYIIGDELIPGAVGLEALRARIANMRACGKTFCETTEAAAPAPGA